MGIIDPINAHNVPVNRFTLALHQVRLRPDDTWIAPNNIGGQTETF